MAVQAIQSIQLPANKTALSSAEEASMRLQTVLAILSDDVDELAEIVTGNAQAARQAERLLQTLEIAKDYRVQLQDAISQAQTLVVD